MRTTIQRVAGALFLLLAGVGSLPVAAAFLDGEGTENWIVPVQMGGMIMIGAVLALAFPALAHRGASRVGRAVIGGCWGIAAAGVGVLIFWFLLNGTSGA